MGTGLGIIHGFHDQRHPYILQRQIPKFAQLIRTNKHKLLTMKAVKLASQRYSVTEFHLTKVKQKISIIKYPTTSSRSMIMNTLLIGFEP